MCFLGVELGKVSLFPEEIKSDCGAELSFAVKVLLGFSPCIHLSFPKTRATFPPSFRNTAAFHCLKGLTTKRESNFLHEQIVTGQGGTV